MFSNPHFNARRTKIATINSLVSDCVKNINGSSVKTSQNGTNIQKSITVAFREQYDIMSIHRIIINKIKCEYDTAYYILNKIDALNIYKDSDISLVEKRSTISKINKLDEKYKRFSDPNRLEHYTKEAEKYIKEYQSIPPSSHVIDIMDKYNNKYIPNEDDFDRITVIKEYIRFAKNYIVIDMTCTGHKSSTLPYQCDCCNTDLRNITINSDGSIICPNCFKHKYMKGICSVSENSEVETNNSSYVDTENFIKALHKYQGKLVPKLDMNSIMVSLDKHFESIGFPNRDIIKTRELDSKGRRTGTTITIMLNAMSSTGLKYYSDVHYFAHVYWDWVLQDLTSIEDLIIEDYRKTQQVWYSIPQNIKDRRSSLPTAFRLLSHLRMRGQMVDESDFKIPKNISHYNELWKIMCEGAQQLDPSIQYMPL